MLASTVQHLQQLGAEVEEVSLPSFGFGLPAYYVIALSEASSNLSRYDGVRYGHRSEAEGEPGRPCSRDLTCCFHDIRCCHCLQAPAQHQRCYKGVITVDLHGPLMPQPSCAACCLVELREMYGKTRHAGLGSEVRAAALADMAGWIWLEFSSHAYSIAAAAPQAAYLQLPADVHAFLFTI